MRRLRILLLLCALALPSAALPACSTPVTIVTEPGRIAYRADQIVVRINALQNAAIQAHANGGLPEATARTLIEFAVSANRVLKETPAGWQVTTRTAWTQAKARIGPVSNPVITAAMDAVDVVLAAF